MAKVQLPPPGSTANLGQQPTWLEDQHQVAKCREYPNQEKGGEKKSEMAKTSRR